MAKYRIGSYTNWYQKMLITMYYHVTNFHIKTMMEFQTRELLAKPYRLYQAWVTSTSVIEACFFAKIATHIFNVELDFEKIQVD